MMNENELQFLYRYNGQPWQLAEDENDFSRKVIANILKNHDEGDNRKLHVIALSIYGFTYSVSVEVRNNRPMNRCSLDDFLLIFDFEVTAKETGDRVREFTKIYERGEWDDR